MAAPVDLNSDQHKIVTAVAQRYWPGDVEGDRLMNAIKSYGRCTEPGCMEDLYALVKIGRKSWRGGNARRVLDQLKAIADEVAEHREAQSLMVSSESQVKP